MRMITNRTDIEVPSEYRRTFEVPDGIEGRALCEAVKEKIGNDWSYLDLCYAKLQHAELRYVDLSYVYSWRVDFRGADLREAKLNGVNLWRADFTDAKGVDFSGTRYTRSAKHKRIIEIPEIEWNNRPIAAVMPEGAQPLLISIGCETHTPEVWSTFTPIQLVWMDEKAPEWYEAHMESAIKKAHELESGWRKNIDRK